ncbi:putative 14-3-3 protein [Helianthus annuus]|nr:putative 14-3-3 protein [Helianthus annuus]
MIDGVNHELTVLSYDGLSPASDGNCIPQKSRSFWNNLLSLRSTEASCEDNVYMAKLAEQAERYKEMVEFMEKIVDSEELTPGGHHGGHIFYRKEESRGNEDHVKLFKDYRATIETELSKICDGILGLLGSHLVPFASSSEAKIFYLKMKGDYFGYLAEFKTGVDRKEAAESTLLAYKSAQAFDEAIAELDTLGEDSYKDSTLIMQLIHDNLTLWTYDIANEAGDEIKESSKAEETQ